MRTGYRLPSQPSGETPLEQLYGERVDFVRYLRDHAIFCIEALYGFIVGAPDAATRVLKDFHLDLDGELTRIRRHLPPRVLKELDEQSRQPGGATGVRIYAKP